jgi:hypothetical protein
MDGQAGGVVVGVRQGWTEGRCLRHACAPVSLYEDGRVAVLDSTASKLIQDAVLWATYLLGVVGSHAVRMEQGHTHAAHIMLGGTSSIKAADVAESTLCRAVVFCRVLHAREFASLVGFELVS